MNHAHITGKRETTNEILILEIIQSADTTVLIEYKSVEMIANYRNAFI